MTTTPEAHTSMEKTLDEVKAEHLSNCMCLELIEHANLAIGDINEERSYLETMIREKVCIGQQRIPTGLTSEGGVFCTKNRGDLVGALVFIWEHDMQEHYINLTRIKKYIGNMVYSMIKLLQETHSQQGYIILRAKTQFALQCYRMTKAMIEAKKKLPAASAPTEDFFAAMLPVVCRTDFKELLTAEVVEHCPLIW